MRLDFQIHLTDDCNLKCLHCYNENRGRYLTSDRFDYILNEILAYMKFLAVTPGKVSFCGGEPSLSPILLDCIRKCVNAGFKDIQLLTNGTRITDDFAKKLIKAGCAEVQVCIEGSRETHNQIRGGTWNKVLRAWDICRNHGIRTVNQTTINPLNYKEIDDIVHICKDRVDWVRFLRQVPHNDKVDVLTASQWMETMESILYGLRHQKQLYRGFVIVKDIFWSHVFRSMLYRCPFTMEYTLLPIIECNGDVYICRRANVAIGNIFSENLVSIYKNSDLLKKTRNRKNLNAQCKDCQNTVWCGGCRGMALAVNGDIMAEDPHCIIHKDIPAWARELMAENLKPVSNVKSSEIEVTEAEVADYMKIAGIYALPIQEVINRKVIAGEAKREGIVISTEELQKAADVFRIANGLNEASSALRWLEEKGVSLDTLEDFIETNLLIDKFKGKRMQDAGEKQ